MSTATMPPRYKAHREFFAIRPDADDTRWTPVACDAGRIEEILLGDSFNATDRRGSRTRLARWAPGTQIAEPVVHEFHEEVFLLEGELVVGGNADGLGGETFRAYTFACRPPGAVHGPFASPRGCLMLEFQYYDSL